MQKSPRLRDGGFLIEAAIVGMMTFALAGAMDLALDGRRGNLADWVVAVATVAAFVAAAAAARAAWKMFALEHQRNVANQAVEIAAWVREPERYPDRAAIYLKTPRPSVFMT